MLALMGDRSQRVTELDEHARRAFLEGAAELIAARLLRSSSS